MVGVILCSKARFSSAANRASMSSSRMSAARCELHGQAGVEHVGRRSCPGARSAGSGPDEFGEMRQEGDDVVLGDARFGGPSDHRAAWKSVVISG